MFSSWFIPLGSSVSILIIQKSSRRFRRSLRVSLLTFAMLVNCPFRVNFARFMKLWPCILKWWHAGIAFGLLTSFLWLFRLKLKRNLDFPTYWILNNMHFINPNLGGLFRGPLWDVRERVKLPLPPRPYLKLVRIMLESWKLARKYTHICNFRKYTF